MMKKQTLRRLLGELGRRDSHGGGQSMLLDLEIAAALRR